MVRTLANAVSAPLRRRLHALEHLASVHEDFLYDQAVVLQTLALVFLLPVGDGGAQQLLQSDRSLFLAVAKDTQRLVDFDSPDQVGDNAHLQRRGRAVVQHGDRLLLLFGLQFFGSYAFSCTHFTCYFFLLPE